MILKGAFNLILDSRFKQQGQVSSSKTNDLAGINRELQTKYKQLGEDIGE